MNIIQLGFSPCCCNWRPSGIFKCLSVAAGKFSVFMPLLLIFQKFLLHRNPFDYYKYQFTSAFPWGNQLGLFPRIKLKWIGLAERIPLSAPMCDWIEVWVFLCGRWTGLESVRFLHSPVHFRIKTESSFLMPNRFCAQMAFSLARHQ